MYHVMLSVLLILFTILSMPLGPRLVLIASATPDGTKFSYIVISLITKYLLITFSGCNITDSNFCRFLFILENLLSRIAFSICHFEHTRVDYKCT